MKTATATNPTITSGMLIKKIDPHHVWESSQPPTIGPSGIPTAVEVTQMFDAGTLGCVGEDRRQHRHRQRNHQCSADAKDAVRAAISMAALPE